MNRPQRSHLKGDEWTSKVASQREMHKPQRHGYLSKRCSLMGDRHGYHPSSCVQPDRPVRSIALDYICDMVLSYADRYAARLWCCTPCASMALLVPLCFCVHMLELRYAVHVCICGWVHGGVSAHFVWTHPSIRRELCPGVSRSSGPKPLVLFWFSFFPFACPPWRSPSWLSRAP